MMSAGQNLTINPQRLWDSLMETAQFGATPKGGIKRLTLTDDDKKVRDWFKRECEKLGCTLTVDEVGNMFAVRAGKNPDALPIAMGSHLDTQPTGGKFDGALGVLGALEAMRTLVDLGYETNAPVMIVNWTNEEGSRFAPAMLASGVYAGVFTAGIRLCPRRPPGSQIRRRTAAHRLSRHDRGRRGEVPGDVRAAHRAGADSGG